MAKNVVKLKKKTLRRTRINITNSKLYRYKHKKGVQDNFYFVCLFYIFYAFIGSIPQQLTKNLKKQTQLQVCFFIEMVAATGIEPVTFRV